MTSWTEDVERWSIWWRSSQHDVLKVATHLFSAPFDWVNTIIPYSLRQQWGIMVQSLSRIAPMESHKHTDISGGPNLRWFHSPFPPPRTRQCCLYIALERVGQQAGLSGQQSTVMCYTSLRNHILLMIMIMVKPTKHIPFICTSVSLLKAGGFTCVVSLVLKTKYEITIMRPQALVGPQILAQRTPWWKYHLGQKTLHVPQAKMKTKT